MNRRSKPPNRYGCKPDEDVCVEHDEPLICKHGCSQVDGHNCEDYRQFTKEFIASARELDEDDE